MGAQEGTALGQRLLVADDQPHIGKLRPLHAQQVLPDGLVPHSGHRQVGVGVEQVQHGGHIAGVGVFKGQHAQGGIAVFDGVAHLVPGRKGFGPAQRVEAAQRDVAPRALHPLIGRRVPPQKLPLVRPRDRQRLGQKAVIIGPQGRVLHPGGVFFDQRGLPRGVKDGFSGAGLVLGHLRNGLHPLLKQRGHLRVDAVNDGARLLKLVGGLLVLLHTVLPIPAYSF